MYIYLCGWIRRRKTEKRDFSCVADIKKGLVLSFEKCKYTRRATRRCSECYMYVGNAKEKTAVSDSAKKSEKSKKIDKNSGNDVELKIRFRSMKF